MGNHELIPVKMRKEDMNLPEVQAFRCVKDPHEKPLEDWIKKSSFDQIRGGTKVWLYRLEHDKGPLVGYGSLATDHLDTIESDNSKGRINTYVIPMLALQIDYWRKPENVVDKERRYSRQIVHHLQKEAREAQKKGTREPLLGLYVHPHAIAAQKLYLACGFRWPEPPRYLSVPEVTPDMAEGLLGMEYVWTTTCTS